jgi:hypothetical protein
MRGRNSRTVHPVVKFDVFVTLVDSDVSVEVLADDDSVSPDVVEVFVVLVLGLESSVVVESGVVDVSVVTGSVVDEVMASIQAVYPPSIL